MVACQQHSRVPSKTDTVIVGNGPSALFLSYLLHGHAPYYNRNNTTAHPDRILDRKLRQDAGRPFYYALRQTNRLCDHFEASGRYTTDAWPVNALLASMLQPDAELGWDNESTISFEHDEAFRHNHVVLGAAEQAGGQWAEPIAQDNGETARTLSYSEQLSLPGYAFADFYAARYGNDIGDFERPRRPEVSAYYAAYPAHVGITDTLWNGTRVNSVERTASGSYMILGTDVSTRPFSIECRNVVLACGLFTNLMEPPDMLLPYIGRRSIRSLQHPGPILIIGSGFSAADAIVENLGRRPIIHLYKWHSAKYISPLKHCHRSSYPEYADIYRRMKLSAQTNPIKFAGYRGFADVDIMRVQEIDGSYIVTMAGSRLDKTLDIQVDEITVLAGRRTSLDFFSHEILSSLAIDSSQGWLEKTGLRDQITPDGGALTVDNGRILCIGSITGDSLVKFMYGAAIGAAGQLYGI